MVYNSHTSYILEESHYKLRQGYIKKKTTCNIQHDFDVLPEDFLGIICII